MPVLSVCRRVAVFSRYATFPSSLSFKHYLTYQPFSSRVILIVRVVLGVLKPSKHTSVVRLSTQGPILPVRQPVRSTLAYIPVAYPDPAPDPQTRADPGEKPGTRETHTRQVGVWVGAF